VLADMARALREEAALVFFPSGRLAFLQWHGLKERPWLPTVVTVARKFDALILPLHIRSRNSWLFYALSQLSHELRDVTLFHELLNKRGRLFEITIGLPVDPADLPDDPAEATRRLQHHVEFELPRASRLHPRIARGPNRRLARASAQLR
jgi:putative hemolysin